MTIKKNVLRIMLGSIIIEVLLICLFIILGNFNDVSAFALSSAGIVFGYALPCLLYAKIYDNEKYKYIAISGAVIVFVAALISILALWGVINVNVTYAKTLGILNVIIWALAFISVVLSYDIDTKSFRIFRLVFIISLSLLSLCIINTILNGDFPEGILLRLCFVLLVLTVGSAACVSILLKMYQKEHNEK